MKSLRSRFAAACGPLPLAAMLLMSACGGGGDGGGPSARVDPITGPLDMPHAIANTPDEARLLAQLSDSLGRRALQAQRDLNAFDEQHGLARLIIRTNGSDDAAAERPEGEDFELDCNRNPFRLFPFLCYGRFEYRRHGNAGRDQVHAGSSMGFAFSNFNVIAPPFERLKVNGGFAFEYAEDYSESPRKGTLRYQSHGLSTNHGEDLFSPSNGSLSVRYGAPLVTIDANQLRVSAPDIDATTSSNGVVRSAQVRGNAPDGHIDIVYSGWTLVDGVPQVGGRASISGAPGNTASVEVVELRAQTIVLRVTIVSASGTRVELVEIPRTILAGA